MWRWYLIFSLGLMLGACGGDSRPQAKKVRAADPERGKRIYLAQCTSCHNSDPSRDGPVGPAIKGSSQALLEARVLRGNYPPGYTPKRKTSLMPPQKALESVIPDLAAYLR